MNSHISYSRVLHELVCYFSESMYSKSSDDFRTEIMIVRMHYQEISCSTFVCYVPTLLRGV